MLTAKDVKNITGVDTITPLSLEQLIVAAQANHVNYAFIDRKLVNSDLQNELRKLGYNLLVGYGDLARIKISWEYEK